MGSFDAGEGDYTLDLDILQDASRLNAGSPRLLVVEDGSGRWDLYGKASATYFVCVILGGLGLFLIIRSVGARRTSVLSPTWVGAALVAAGLIAFASVTVWCATRKTVAVDRPVSLGRGHIKTGPFRLNLSSDYDIQLSVDHSYRGVAGCPRRNCAPGSVAGIPKRTSKRWLQRILLRGRRDVFLWELRGRERNV